MEAKASRMSQRSNPGQAKVGKITSKASLTPSQMSERTRLNAAAANKDPLDALSRLGTRQTNAERRSGLQDVDDEYLKTVVYAFSKQAGQSAADRAKVTAEMQPAGVPTARTPNRAPAGSEPVAATQEQQQAQVTAQPQQAQIQQNQAPTPVTKQAPMQIPTQAQAAPPSSPQDAAISAEKPQAAQQESVPPAHGGAAQPRQGGGGGEAELYTTCPNCRATLYLVRNAGDASPYAAQQGDSAQVQQ